MLMDGAMGTELQRAGLAAGESAELWNLTYGERVQAIHQAYVEAGSECLLTNTFQANRQVLEKKGWPADLETVSRKALELARAAAGPERFVLGDIGPIEDKWRMPPLQQVVRSLRAADAILLETFSDLDGLWAVKYVCRPCIEDEQVPVLLSLTYRRAPDGVLTTEAGQPPEVFARLASSYGVAALGVNCGRHIGLDETIEIIRRYRRLTDLPLFARPNAGTPNLIDGKWFYPLTPLEMAVRLPELIEAGANLIGGCCGTTPAHIVAFRRVIDDYNAQASRAMATL